MNILTLLGTTLILTGFIAGLGVEMTIVGGIILAIGMVLPSSKPARS